jgi:hypothetical protein
VAFGDAADGGHDLARRAETALHAVMIDEGLLDRMERVSFRQSLDRRDLGAVVHGGQCQARDDPPAVEEHRARTACTLIAALLRAGEIESLAQDVEQGLSRIELQRMALTVDRKLYAHDRHLSLDAGIHASGRTLKRNVHMANRSFGPMPRLLRPDLSPQIKPRFQIVAVRID